MILRNLLPTHLEWIKQFGDLGAIPEKELVASWWQGKDKAPETASPEITLKDGKVHITSATKGASVAYKKHEKEKEWQVYAKPFPIHQSDSLYVIAHRIGFSASKVIKINPRIK